MTKILVIAGRVIRQINGDKRTLVIMIIAPILIISILYFILSAQVSIAKVDIVDTGSLNNEAIDSMKDVADVHIAATEDEAVERILSGESDGYFLPEKVVVEGTDPSITGLVIKAYKEYSINTNLQSMPANVSTLAGKIFEQPEVDNFYTDTEYETFDFLAPSIMGFIIFFLVFLLSGIAFLRERISGTLEKIMATSVKRRHIVIGYFLGFGLFVLIQTVLIQVFMIYVLRINTYHNFGLVLVANLGIAFASLSLGTLLSAFARNEFQLFQFIPIIIIPQILFSGLFNIREASGFMRAIEKIFPLSYGSQALRDVMLRNQGFWDIAPNLGIVLLFMAGFIILNIKVLKRYRDA
ncbi:MAG: ABC transporter permease [Eubacteriales bacterium]